MNRLGFRVEDFADAHDVCVRIAGPDNAPTLVTHLASADDRRDPKTARQLRGFRGRHARPAR